MCMETGLRLSMVLGRKAIGGIPADVEQYPRLKAVFYIPSLQDIHILLILQLVSFLSKGFNAIIFLLQL